MNRNINFNWNNGLGEKDIYFFVSYNYANRELHLDVHLSGNSEVRYHCTTKMDNDEWLKNNQYTQKVVMAIVAENLLDLVNLPVADEIDPEILKEALALGSMLSGEGEHTLMMHGPNQNEGWAPHASDEYMTINSEEASQSYSRKHLQMSFDKGAYVDLMLVNKDGEWSLEVGVEIWKPILHLRGFRYELGKTLNPVRFDAVMCHMADDLDWTFTEHQPLAGMDKERVWRLVEGLTETFRHYIQPLLEENGAEAEVA